MFLFLRTGLGVDMVEGAAKTLGLYLHSIALKEINIVLILITSDKLSRFRFFVI